MLYRHGGVPLERALFVQTQVMSRPPRDQAVVDAGFKAIGTTIGTASLMPEVVDRPDLEVITCAAKSQLLRLHGGGARLQLGDKLDLVVPIVDCTVFLHDPLYGVRDGIVETVWDTEGRGRLQ